jgi:DNA-binding transcriptional MerR regulator
MNAMAKSVLPKLLTIKEAAGLLRVAEVTLRRWDASGKFKAGRHPMNNYRVYAERDVLRLRGRIWSGKAA